MGMIKHNLPDYSDIERLVEKFLDGYTTNSEEQALYEWFATNEVPAEWSELKEMFAWYADGMLDNIAVEEQHRTHIESNPHRRSIILHIGGWGIAAAAVITIGIVLWPQAQHTTTTRNIYEGSYIVENGVRNSDIKYIQDDIEAVLERADDMERRANELLAWADI